MDLMGLCSVCGKPAQIHTCNLCGRSVCSNCFDPTRGLCKNCQFGKKI